jgi:hypothetical protein
MDDPEAGNGPGVIKRAMILQMTPAFPSLLVRSAWNSLFQAFQRSFM